MQEHQGRIKAIYIRDVTTVERDAEVRAMADEARQLGTEMVAVRYHRGGRARGFHGSIAPDDSRGPGRKRCQLLAHSRQEARPKLASTSGMRSSCQVIP